MGASQKALSIQNPSQAGPRTQGDGNDTVLAVAAGSAPSAKTVLAMVAFVGQLSLVDGINFRIRLFSKVVKSNVIGLSSFDWPNDRGHRAQWIHPPVLRVFFPVQNALLSLYPFRAGVSAPSCCSRSVIEILTTRDDRKSHPFSLNRPTAPKFLNE